MNTSIYMFLQNIFNWLQELSVEKIPEADILLTYTKFSILNFYFIIYLAITDIE